jgi:hypothetical protein
MALRDRSHRIRSRDEHDTCRRAARGDRHGDIRAQRLADEHDRPIMSFGQPIEGCGPVRQQPAFARRAAGTAVASIRHREKPDPSLCKSGGEEAVVEDRVGITVEEYCCRAARLWRRQKRSEPFTVGRRDLDGFAPRRIVTPETESGIGARKKQCALGDICKRDDQCIDDRRGQKKRLEEFPGRRRSPLVRCRVPRRIPRSPE